MSEWNKAQEHYDTQYKVQAYEMFVNGHSVDSIADLYQDGLIKLYDSWIISVSSS